MTSEEVAALEAALKELTAAVTDLAALIRGEANFRRGWRDEKDAAMREAARDMPD